MRKKYLTEENFEKWKSNDFHHVCKKIARMDGILWVLAPLTIAILTMLAVLLSR